jgi:hypothetical protein
MSSFVFPPYERKTQNKIRVKREYLIDIGKYKGIYCNVFIYTKTKIVLFRIFKKNS